MLNFILPVCSTTNIAFVSGWNLISNGWENPSDINCILIDELFSAKRKVVIKSSTKLIFI
mgnify:CR=1 FL=1